MARAGCCSEEGWVNRGSLSICVIAEMWFRPLRCFVLRQISLVVVLPRLRVIHLVSLSPDVKPSTFSSAEPSDPGCPKVYFLVLAFCDLFFSTQKLIQSIMQWISGFTRSSCELHTVKVCWLELEYNNTVCWPGGAAVSYLNLQCLYGCHVELQTLCIEIFRMNC